GLYDSYRWVSKGAGDVQMTCAALQILYIDINASFLVPTRGLIPLALQRAGNVVFFGPGHVDEETLNRGLGAFADATGPFDVALTNTHILFADAYDRPASPAVFERHYDLAFPAFQVMSLSAIAKEFERLSIPRVGILLENDYYNWTSREISKLES